MAKRCVLSSARVLAEGVGIPEADAVVFADPRKSIVDTVQTVGRALWQSPQLGTRGISHSPGSR
ncbi:helicase-related protein [Streptomyces lydicus]|uniref:helicase-related protein n=1 Tax=Streptomyces lydicus TaxID=47763 RepID=UPI0037B93FD2